MTMSVKGSLTVLVIYFCAIRRSKRVSDPEPTADSNQLQGTFISLLRCVLMTLLAVVALV